MKLRLGLGLRLARLLAHFGSHPSIRSLVVVLAGGSWETAVKTYPDPDEVIWFWNESPKSPGPDA